MYNYIVGNCPTLKKRLDEDTAKGIFNPLWTIESDESMKYMSGLAGREINGWESVRDTCDEIEEKLTNANDKD